MWRWRIRHGGEGEGGGRRSVTAGLDNQLVSEITQMALAKS
jgi:hypothetical protein